MFESNLQSTLKQIFDLDKVTFNTPSESQEQECLFVEVQSCKPTIKEGRQIAMVKGKLRVFCNAQKMPYGYFSKKIQEAGALAKDLFFYDMEENQAAFANSLGGKDGLVNICERSVSFIFLFDSQYDPEHGTMTSINFNEAES